MKIKVQFCWAGGDRYYWRALIGGGLRISVDSPQLVWTRSEASRMLDLITSEIRIDRSRIRFIHV